MLTKTVVLNLRTTVFLIERSGNFKTKALYRGIIDIDNLYQ